jgi:hypothetical protein
MLSWRRSPASRNPDAYGGGLALGADLHAQNPVEILALAAVR